MVQKRVVACLKALVVVGIGVGLLTQSVPLDTSSVHSLANRPRDQLNFERHERLYLSVYLGPLARLSESVLKQAGGASNFFATDPRKDKTVVKVAGFPRFGNWIPYLIGAHHPEFCSRTRALLLCSIQDRGALLGGAVSHDGRYRGQCAHRRSCARSGGFVVTLRPRRAQWFL